MVREPHLKGAQTVGDQPSSQASAQTIIQICEQEFPKFWNDCAGFVKSVAAKCGVLVTGNANVIVENHLSGRSNFILCDETGAEHQASAGNFVIGGLSESGHGHVVVVVRAQREHGHVFAYWGRFHAVPNFPEINVGRISFGRGGIGQAWKSSALPNVKFGWIKPSLFLLQQNRPDQLRYHL
jgi:hypothetical protein